MKRFVAFVTILVALLAAPAAQAQLNPVQTISGVAEYSLPNGLQVLLVPDNDKPSAMVNITYRVGSRHEGLGETGSAHLLEHMLFKASGKVDNPKLEADRRGLRWNGTTSADRTNYFATFQSGQAGDDQGPERVDFVLGWLAGMMTQARFSRADLDSEMTVVRNEFERAESEPGRVLGDRMRALAFNFHGYGHSTLGARTDIENIPLDALYAFYRKHYRPDNATLIVAGRFDEAAIKAKIVKDFGAIAKPANPLPTTYTLDAVQDGERNVMLRRVGGYASTAVLYRMPAGGVREGIAAWLLSEALQQRSGPLDKGLVTTGLGVTHWAYFRSMREPGFLMAGLGLPDRGETSESQYAIKAQSVSAALAAVVESYQPSEPELQTARASLLAQQRALQRDAIGVGSALSEMVALGDWRLLFAAEPVLQSISLEEVRALARSYLLQSNRTTGTFLPSAESPSLTASVSSTGTQTQTLSQALSQTLSQTSPQGSARAPAPRIPLATDLIAASAIYTASTSQNAASKPTPSFVAESFDITPSALAQRAQTGRLQVGGADGLKIAVLPRASKGDRVNGSLRLRMGTVESLKGAVIEPFWLSNLLVEGTKNKTADQIKAQALALDASISFFSGPGYLTANLEFPAGNALAVFELLNELLRESVFDTQRFTETQRASLASIASQKTNANALAVKALARSFTPPGRYPEGDPRAFVTFEQNEALARAAKLETLRTYWQRFGSAQVGELTLAGPIELASLQPALQNLWGDWTSSEAYANWPDSEHRKGEGEPSTVIRLQDKANAVYNATIPLAMRESDADYPALFVAIQLLSREGLYKRVREKDGLSYGVSADLNTPLLGNAAGINISASFAPQNREKLRTAIREVLLEKREQGFSSLQVNFAKSAILSRRAETQAQVGNALGSMANNLRFNRPLDYSDSFTEKYKAVTMDAVDAALKKYLDIDALIEVMAGSFE